MMKLDRITYGLFMMTLAMFSCKKDDAGLPTRLPPETSSGKNTLGFESRFGLFVNFGQHCFLDGSCRENTSSYVYVNDRVASFGAELTEVKDSTLIDFEYFYGGIRRIQFGPGRYDTRAGDSVDSYYSLGEGSDHIYRLDTLDQEFSVNVSRLDTAARIFSGTFQGKLFREKPDHTGVDRSDSMVIRNGRFDLKWKW
jgi:hypothetical protein